MIFLITALIIMWVVLFGYVFRINYIQHRVQREMRKLCESEKLTEL